MKAVLGLVFILVGVTTGWLVLSGKLPNTNPVAPTPSVQQTSTASTQQAGTAASRPYQGPSANMGIPLRGKAF